MSGLAAPSAILPSSPPVERTGEPVVTVEGLTKRYAVRRGWADLLRLRPATTVTALRGLSMQVESGEFFGLLGPNGAGKTTLFKILSTLVVPDEGRATIAGLDVLARPHEVRGVVSPVVAEERSLHWRISARENLRFYGTLYGLRGAAREQRVDELLDLVGLEEAGNKLVGAFSSGMKQRLLLARALLGQPRVLLLDEPTRSLDPVAARRFRAFLKDEIGTRQGCTVLLATHNTEEALELCDRIAVLDRGRLVAVGKPDELSLQLHGHRYRIRTLGVTERAVWSLENSPLVSSVTVVSEPGLENTIEFEVGGGEETAAQVLTELVREGVAVVGFDRVRLPLADLIEGLVKAGAAGDGDG